MEDVNKGNDEILLKLLEQHWLHCRHLENERAAFMGVYAVLTGGTLAFTAERGFGVWALLFLLVITLVGLFLTMRWIYAFENHRQRVNWMIRKIDDSEKIYQWPLVNLMTMNIPPMKFLFIPVKTRIVFPIFYLIMFLFLGVLLISNVNNLLVTAPSTGATKSSMTLNIFAYGTVTETTYPSTDTSKKVTKSFASKLSGIFQPPGCWIGLVLLGGAVVCLIGIAKYNRRINEISKLYVTDVMITWTPEELKSWINRDLKLKKTPNVDDGLIETIYQKVKTEYEENPGDPINQTKMSRKIEELLPSLQ